MLALLAVSLTMSAEYNCPCNVPGDQGQSKKPRYHARVPLSYYIGPLS
jgi:hypothetical protein